jgi:hypothetical protein
VLRADESVRLARLYPFLESVGQEADQENYHSNRIYGVSQRSTADSTTLQVGNPPPLTGVDDCVESLNFPLVQNACAPPGYHR